MPWNTLQLGYIFLCVCDLCRSRTASTYVPSGLTNSKQQRSWPESTHVPACLDWLSELLNLYDFFNWKNIESGSSCTTMHKTWYESSFFQIYQKDPVNLIKIDSVISLIADWIWPYCLGGCLRLTFVSANQIIAFKTVKDIVIFDSLNTVIFPRIWKLRKHGYFHFNVLILFYFHYYRH